MIRARSIQSAGACRAPASLRIFLASPSSCGARALKNFGTELASSQSADLPVPQFNYSKGNLALRERCTTAQAGQVLTVHPCHALLAAARHAAADPAWQDEYRRWRPPAQRAPPRPPAPRHPPRPTRATPKTTPRRTTPPPPATPPP